ncbi:serine hydrolase domain-containing protein [Flagellimonas sp. S174]|uniref:serine hydrolase domain-containing protein n=1 Tax=Flagellimonas sp. S174 TaxID=3410790 RepID=UPI003BF5CC5B
MIKKIFLGLLICLSLVACQNKKTTLNDSKNTTQVAKDSLDKKLTMILQKGSIIGYGVAVVNQDTTLYSKGFGLSKVDEKKPYTKSTIQNIASVSKTIIGVALLKAQENGDLNLDDAINKYLPFEVINPYFPKDTITIRQLATHTSSIQDGETYGDKSYVLQNGDDLEMAKSLPISEEFNAPNEMLDMGTFLEYFLSEEGKWFNKSNYLELKPGERFEYSNVGATLAAYIIERATGQSYSEYTAEHILRPLGMTATGWQASNVDTDQLSHLFTVEGSRIPDYTLITYPDGGLITSVEDMAKYLSELIQGYSGKGKLLSKASYAQLFDEFLSDDNFEEERDTERLFDDEYNSGLFMGHTPIGYIGHTGGDPGVSTFMFFNPKTKIGKLLFVNTDLDQKGANQFFTIWDTLGEYELLLNE